MIPRIHTYAALVTLVNLLVYAIAGVAPRSLAPPVVWEQPFESHAGESDRDIAGRVVGSLGLSLATPVHDFNISHDASRRLVLDFYHANGRHKIIVLENPSRLHIENSRAGFAKYLSTLHVTTAAFHSSDARMQWWSWYNEFAMWALTLMLATGIWMLATRRGKPCMPRRIHWITALASAPVLALFTVTAVQMAHRRWLPAGAVLRAMNSLHRSHALPPVATFLLLMLAATGFYLWLNGRDRRAGAVLLAIGATISGGLLFWMRAG